MDLLQKQQVGLGRHVEIAGDREQALEHPADRDVLDRKAADRLARGAKRGGELLHAVVRGHILRLEVDFGDSPVVAGDQAVEDFGEPDPGAPVDPAHDPEVDHRYSPVGKREQIAVVEVGVKEAVDDRLAKESTHQGGGKSLAVVPGVDERVAFVELDALQPFERKHPPGGPAPVDLRNVIAGLGDHILLQLGGGRSLPLEVELAHRPLPELGDDQPGAKPRRFTATRLDLRRRPFVGLDGAGEFLLDSRDGAP
jgi:hypothetical protein